MDKIASFLYFANLKIPEMKYILLIPLFFFANNNSNEKSVKAHPIHLSVTTVEWSETEGFKISIRLFTDDFEKIINRNYNTQLFLGLENENSSAGVFIDKYIKSHLDLEFDQASFNLKNMILTSREHTEKNVTWLKYSLQKPFRPQLTSVKNSLMTDLYPDQKNLFMYKNHNINKNIIFTSSHKEEIF